jgi:membrane associated rhomboid family serine protease
MAFRSNNPISLVFPPFRGVTRRIILIALCVYLGMAVIGLFSPVLAGVLMSLFELRADQALHPLIWELVTYPFMGQGLLSVAFALLSLWFFGSALEEERGSRWLGEFFLVATIGGAAIASALSLAAAGHVPGLGPQTWVGLWPAVLAVLVAYGRIHAEDQVKFNLLFTIKAKYLAAIYVLFYVGLALVGGDRFGALTALCNAGVGYGFLLLAPQRGFRVGVSERWFALRNAYYRAKRRRAAKKFTVYMRKQGKDVPIDEDGRYVDPEGGPRGPNGGDPNGRDPNGRDPNGRDPNGRDPNDKRWMN